MSLDLDPRQRAMLHEMGLPRWVLAPALAVPQAVPAQTTAPGPATAARSGAAPQLPVAPATPVPAPAPGVPAQSLDWSQLGVAVRECQDCRLCVGRKAAVFGAAHGTNQADWFVLGEPPDEDEERAGAPFVGDQGRLLDNMLLSVGVARSGTGAGGAWLSKVVKCRPGVPRNPEPAELAQCALHLQRELALVRPRIILAMGRIAAQALLAPARPDVASMPLGKLRGQVHRFQGLPVVVTYAPDSLLRTQSDKAKAWADLCLARQALAGA